MEMEEKLPDNDADGKLNGNQFLKAERVAAARPGGVFRMGEGIEPIIARDNLEQPALPPVWMPVYPRRDVPSRVNWTLTCRNFAFA